MPPKPPTTNPERRFLRTLTPPPRSPHSDSSSSVDSAVKWPPDEVDTTGCRYDPEDDLWRCVHCGWEVETFDGVQGRCRGGHEVDLTRVDGWHSTSVWDNGMWSAESGEESDEEGVPRKVRRSCSGGEWLILPREGVRGEGSGEAGGGMEVDEGSEGDSMVDFIVDDEEEEEDGGGGVCEGEMDEGKDGGDGKVADGGAMLDDIPSS